MVLDLIPVEMRCPSVITILLFAIGASIVWYLHRRINSLETVVVARCIDIEKLGVVADNLEKMIRSNNDDNRQTIAWIREENTALGDRIEKDIAEMRKEIHRGT
jgi:predicted Holliday junction resolvase-like endonuclease